MNKLNDQPECISIYLLLVLVIVRFRKPVVVWPSFQCCYSVALVHLVDGDNADDGLAKQLTMTRGIGELDCH